MLKLFIAALSVALLYWLWHKKNQIFSKRNNKVDPFITTIEAIELQTFLDWDTPQLCLESDGIRYGKQFKHKLPPDLPHESRCRCEVTKLFYTSDDVFQGTSPILTHKSALGEISSKDALLLKNILLKIITDSKEKSFTDFLAQFELNSFSADIRTQAISLAEKAFQSADNK
ncbi:MAG: hypothetical protein MK510_04470 [SAR324 cluster bacterium]|jgi:hypothetical protein|nr:hypothetical protein [SAR324 cluster bacterium]MCH2265915.1 hypothetical protein [SAR324 cluster bacterium]MCH2269793.1 hypothetical protein [SAR324 cluster bacterium]|tara:strand:+ start:189 stop:704 length:516 start_codon:yes stop_codon:yes gene_type:complete